MRRNSRPLQPMTWRSFIIRHLLFPIAAFICAPAATCIALTKERRVPPCGERMKLNQTLQVERGCPQPQQPRMSPALGNSRALFPYDVLRLGTAALPKVNMKIINGTIGLVYL